MRRHLRPLVVASFITLATGTAFAQLVTTDYTGPNNGSWNLAGNWSGGAVPQNGTPAGVTYNVRLNNGATVAIPTSVTRSINDLLITATSGVSIGNNGGLTLSDATGVDLNNAGLLTIDSGPNLTDLTFSNDTNFTGGGAIVLTNVNSRILGSSRLTITSGTVRGIGQLGVNQLAFTNLGLITANVSGGTLSIDPGNVANAFVNTGTLNASNGGVLSLTGSGAGAFNNTSGIIEARTGSTVQFISSASITGGTLRTPDATGTIEVPASNTATLSSFTNLGRLNLQNNSNLNVAGAIVNNGVITVNAGPNLTDIIMTAPTTYSGSGKIVLASTNSRLYGNSLVNSAAHTIEGQGALGVNTTSVVNDGLILANVAGAAMVLDPANVANAFVNHGMLRAAGGATLAFTGSGAGAFTNTLATIEATGAGSVVQLVTSANVSGGTIRATGGGLIQIPASHTAFLQDVTLEGPSQLQNNGTLNLSGTITNSGTMSIDAGGNLTDISINAVGSTTTFTGGGVLSLAGSAAGSNARVLGSGSLVSTNFTIQGEGQLGANTISITNNALIDANVNGRAITIDPRNNAIAFVNNGTVRATNGGTVVLSGSGAGVFDNTSGTIQARTGSTALLTLSAVINGGILSTPDATGSFELGASDTASLNSVTLNGRLNTANNSTLNVSGSISNNGLLTVNAGGNLTDLSVADGTTFAGTGKIALAGTGNARILGAGVLTLNQPVEGRGNLGSNVISIINNSVISANDVALSLMLDPRNSPVAFDNNGTLRASNGGTLILTGSGAGVFDNTGAVIEALAGSTVRLTTGATVTGGVLRTPDATGTFEVGASDTVSLNALTLNGRLNAANNSTMNLSGTLTNNGTITVNAGGNITDLNVADGTVFNGTGKTVLGGSAANGRVLGGGTLTVANGYVVEGMGNIGSNVLTVINNGTISANINAQTLTLDPRNATPAFTNNGELRATNGGTLNLTGSGAGVFTGAGSVDVAANSTLNLTTSANADFVTTITGAGTVSVTNSASLTATRYQVANVVVNTSGVAAIRAGGGNAGTSDIDSLTIATSGRFDVTDHGLIVDYTGATPAATLRGYLKTGRANGAWNGTGIGSSLANNNTRAVGYAETNQIGSPATFLGVAVDSTAVVLRFTLNGDLDLNGAVNFDDLLVLAQNYGATGTGTWRTGDVTYDDNINFDDLLALAQTYGAALAIDGSVFLDSAAHSDFGFAWATAQSLVPEPASLTMITLPLFIASRRRR